MILFFCKISILQRRIHGRVSFCQADKNDFVKVGGVVTWILSYNVIKVMHELDSRLSYRKLKNRSKTEELNKRIQTYWQSSWMTCSTCQFHAKQSKNLLMLILFDIFLWVKNWGGTWRCSNGISNKRIVWIKTCRFDAYIHWPLFVLYQIQLTICTVSVLPIHHMIQWMM